jgi:hypothetical protein
MGLPPTALQPLNSLIQLLCAIRHDSLAVTYDAPDVLAESMALACGEYAPRLADAFLYGHLPSHPSFNLSFDWKLDGISGKAANVHGGSSIAFECAAVLRSGATLASRIADVCVRGPELVNAAAWYSIAAGCLHNAACILNAPEVKAADPTLAQTCSLSGALAPSTLAAFKVFMVAQAQAAMVLFASGAAPPSGTSGYLSGDIAASFSAADPAQAQTQAQAQALAIDQTTLARLHFGASKLFELAHDRFAFVCPLPASADLFARYASALHTAEGNFLLSLMADHVRMGAIASVYLERAAASLATVSQKALSRAETKLVPNSLRDRRRALKNALAERLRLPRTAKLPSSICQPANLTPKYAAEPNESFGAELVFKFSPSHRYAIDLVDADLAAEGDSTALLLRSLRETRASDGITAAAAAAGPAATASSATISQLSATNSHSRGPVASAPVFSTSISAPAPAPAEATGEATAESPAEVGTDATDISPPQSPISTGPMSPEFAFNGPTVVPKAPTITASMAALLVSLHGADTVSYPVCTPVASIASSASSTKPASNAASPATTPEVPQSTSDSATATGPVPLTPTPTPAGAAPVAVSSRLPSDLVTAEALSLGTWRSDIQLRDLPQDRDRYLATSQFLGTGAFKTVVKGLDKTTAQSVAINIVRDPENLDQVVSEVLLLASMDHPHIIRLLDAWVDRKAKEVRFVTSLADDGSLTSFRRKMVEATGATDCISTDAVRNYSRQILLALAFLHKHHVCHRDVKLDNVFVSSASGLAMLGDYGISRLVDHTADNLSTLAGTLPCLAPEVAEGQYGLPADIYSFGATVLQLTTGHMPFMSQSPSPSPQRLMLKLLQGARPERELALVKDPHLREFIELAMRPDPVSRPTSLELLHHPFITGTGA